MYKKKKILLQHISQIICAKLLIYMKLALKVEENGIWLLHLIFFGYIINLQYILHQGGNFL